MIKIKNVHDSINDKFCKTENKSIDFLIESQHFFCCSLKIRQTSLSYGFLLKNNNEILFISLCNERDNEIKIFKFNSYEEILSKMIFYSMYEESVIVPIPYTDLICKEGTIINKTFINEFFTTFCTAKSSLTDGLYETENHDFFIKCGDSCITINNGRFSYIDESLKPMETLYKTIKIRKCCMFLKLKESSEIKY